MMIMFDYVVDNDDGCDDNDDDDCDDNDDDDGDDDDEDKLTAKANNGKYTSIKHRYEKIPIPINITINAIDLFFANIL